MTRGVWCAMGSICQTQLSSNGCGASVLGGSQGMCHVGKKFWSDGKVKNVETWLRPSRGVISTRPSPYLNNISCLFLLSLKNLFPSPLPSLCQGELKRQITQLVREESAKQIKVKCGWYTERAMKETLKMAKCNSQKYNSTFQAFIKLCFIPKNIGMWHGLKL